MSGFAGRKRTQFSYVAAAFVAAGVLACFPANAADGTELQLGGFMKPAYGSWTLGDGPALAIQDFGRIEIGLQSSAASSGQFVPSSVGLPASLGRINDFLLPEGAAGASPALRSPRLPTEVNSTAEDNAVSYFTPRFSGVQFGATYTPRPPAAMEEAVLPAQAGQLPVLRRDFAVGVNFLESIEGIDVTLSGGYESASTPTVPGLGETLPSQDEELERYSVGTSIGFSGLRLGGFYAKEVGEGSVSVSSWDAGVSYAVGPWTIGVDYLQSAFIDTSRPSTEGDDELRTVQAGVSYSVGPGIVASFNVLHSSLEDREGNASSGTLGIMGFSYNF
jgi:hypothetical protein